MNTQRKNLKELVHSSPDCYKDKKQRVMNQRGGVSLALKTAFVGVIMAIFIVPAFMSNLISEMAVTTSGEPLGNITLLAFALIVIMVAISAIVQVKRAMSIETEPEMQFIPRGGRF